MIRIRSATPDDSDGWLRLRKALWPDADPADLETEIRRFFAGALRMPLEVLLAVSEQAQAIGFAELSIRPYAEDCETDRVAYLEGWYVDPDSRRLGIGRALVTAAEKWARTQGCTEFASDALLENEASAAAHLAVGFAETVRIRCFRKTLPAGAPGDEP